MKKVVWTGPERMIPNVGMAREGSELTMPDDKADSFVKQGLAEPLKKIDAKKSANVKKEID